MIKLNLLNLLDLRRIYHEWWGIIIDLSLLIHVEVNSQTRRMLGALSIPKRFIKEINLSSVIDVWILNGIMIKSL